MFGGFFALVGFAFLIPVFGLPMFHIIQARSWREVPCTIVRSQVVSHSSGKGGPTYSIGIQFNYDFGGVRHVGTRYDFSVGSSGGFDYRQAIVRHLHRGTHALCYVDPNDPSDAVIDRSIPRDMWYALIPLVFVAVGISIVVFALRSAHPRPVPNGVSGTDIIARARPTQLKESQSRLGKLISIGFCAVFCNGILSIFLRDAYFGNSGRTHWSERLFLIPFLLMGLAFIVAWFYQLLAFFNPRPHIILTNESLALGQSSELRWSFSGNSKRISRLSISIQGREQAIRQAQHGGRGNQNIAQTSTFARLPIVDTTRKMDITAGRGSFKIPADTMHSFKSQNNQIVWSIVLHGEIAGWPDVKSEFPFNVAPLAMKPVHA